MGNPNFPKNIFWSTLSRFFVSFSKCFFIYFLLRTCKISPGIRKSHLEQPAATLNIRKTVHKINVLLFYTIFRLAVVRFVNLLYRTRYESTKKKLPTPSSRGEILILANPAKNDSFFHTNEGFQADSRHNFILGLRCKKLDFVENINLLFF